MKPGELLVQVLGVCGRWQIFISFIIFLSKFGVAWHQLLTVIQAPPVTFTCSDANFTQCDPDCPSYEFDRSIWKQTIQMKWDLVCNLAVLTQVAQTAVMGGILVGNIIFGYLSDRFGRRGPLIMAIILQIVSGCGAAFAPWFSLYVALRFLSTLATGGTMLIPFILLMELTAKNLRPVMGTLYHLPFHLGFAALGAIGYFIRSWDWIQLAVSAPQAILLFYWCFLPESPRWLLIMKKNEQVVSLLEKAAKCNKRPVETVRAAVEACAAETAQRSVRKGGNFLDLFRSRRMRVKSIIMLWNWFSVGAAFYGVAQFMGEVGNTFINISCAGFVQLPGNVICIYSLIYLGRKWSMIASCMVCSIPCFIIACLNETPEWPITVLGCISQMGISMSFSIVYIYTSELYPTEVRNVGIGMCSMTARVGSMICPYIMITRIYASWLPPVILGLTPTLAAVGTLFFLPETKNLRLMDTTEETDAV